MSIVFSVCAVLSLLGLLRAPSELERTERFAFGILLLATLLSPALALIEQLRDISLPSVEAAPPSDALYAQVTEQAFADGVHQAICHAFSLEEGCVRVQLHSFDPERMQADITVSLTGAGAFADHKAVKRFVEEGGLGRCEVVREAG